ncbi:MAG: NAD-dependent deacetylase [Deltaproteobacteria bacterium HGW-Deltaproteobacteria-4]|nr:MAG: NAD-dependent deacetylase [Deltaproteobacteria bacterium HGW-Deltaproteobacteria-4]
MPLSAIQHAAAAAIRTAEALIITAGAGMGVDSGLPDFRGNEGFWNAYPPYRQLGLSFIETANPAHFQRDPAFAWGFYGHRTNLYRNTVPNPGFTILRNWIKDFHHAPFVVTSNVDGQFQKAGFAEEEILEVHGSIHHLQCLQPCCNKIWPNEEEIDIDLLTMRARHLPTCPHCQGVARPNILMFGDFSWLDQRSRQQEERFQTFLRRQQGKRVVVIEIGAGTAIPTIRATSERIGRTQQATVIRINLREAGIASPHLALPCSGLAGLTALDSLLSS